MDFPLAIPGLSILFTLALWGAECVLRIVLAMGVHASAQNRRTVLVGPGWWVLATLLGGVFVAVAYWVLNVSKLAAADGERAVPPPPGGGRA